MFFNRLPISLWNLTNVSTSRRARAHELHPWFNALLSLLEIFWSVFWKRSLGMVAREWGQRQYTCTQCTSLLLVPPPLSHVVFAIPREKQNAPSIRTPVGLRTSKIGWVAVLTDLKRLCFSYNPELASSAERQRWSTKRGWPGGLSILSWANSAAQSTSYDTFETITNGWICQRQCFFSTLFNEQLWETHGQLVFFTFVNSTSNMIFGIYFVMQRFLVIDTVSF